MAGQIGDSGALELDGPYEIAIFEDDTGTYAIVAAYESDTVQIIDITDPSNPAETATVMSGTNFALNGPVVFEVFEDGTGTYVIVVEFHGRILNLRHHRPVKPRRNGKC